jgi:CRISPR-associated endonuclease Cas2
MTTSIDPALLVAYDISDNRKRRNLFKYLSGYGQPLQESLFYCPLDADRRRRLSRELQDVPLDGDEKLHCFLIDPQQAGVLSPSPLADLQWIAE